MTGQKILGVIPARYHSKRFPKKIIYPIKGKPMIYWVYQQALKSKNIGQLIVATDHKDIVEACNSYSIPVMMTSSNLNSGTERIIEVSESIDASLYVNIQGDEPLIDPLMIDGLIQFYLNTNYMGIITLKKMTNNLSDLEDQNIVKVVSNKDDEALYFSRAAIPFNQNPKSHHYKHIGIYAYPKKILKQIRTMKPCVIEEIEQLEQLRYLYHGISIKTLETTYESISVDTLNDINKVIPLIKP